MNVNILYTRLIIPRKLMIQDAYQGIRTLTCDMCEIHLALLAIRVGFAWPWYDLRVSQRD